MTQLESRIAIGSRRPKPRHAVSATPDSTTGSSTGPTWPNCRPKNSPTVRSEYSWVADARTNWNLNDAQSCWASQTTPGENPASAINAASQGYGSASQRRRQSGTNMNAATAGSSIAAVNFASRAQPPNTPAA